MQRYNSISLLRMAAMAAIVLCHILQFYGNVLAWWFNLGVQVFFLISGFLYGQKKIEHGGRFIRKTFYKILLDYYVYLLILTPFYILLTKSGFTLTQIIRLVFGLGGVPGLNHMWFISRILICYALTPVLQKLYDRAPWPGVAILLFCILFELVALPISTTLGPWVHCYVIGYWLGKQCAAETQRSLFHRVNRFAVPAAVVLSALRIYFEYIRQAPLAGSMTSSPPISMSPWRWPSSPSGCAMSPTGSPEIRPSARP